MFLYILHALHLPSYKFDKTIGTVTCVHVCVCVGACMEWHMCVYVHVCVCALLLQWNADCFTLIWLWFAHFHWAMASVSSHAQYAPIPANVVKQLLFRNPSPFQTCGHTTREQSANKKYFLFAIHRVHHLRL